MLKYMCSVLVMRKDKSIAIKLRLSGLSYSKISETLRVPKSTLSMWLRDLQLSDDANRKIKRRGSRGLEALLKRNKLQTKLAKDRRDKIKKLYTQEIRHLSKRELKILGAALYWSEGYKRPVVFQNRELTSHPVALTNSDPMLVQMFLRFLREVCGVGNNKIKAHVRIYQHMNIAHTVKYWQRITQIPSQNFHKSYNGVSKSSQHLRPFQRLPNGTICVKVYDTNLFYKIMGWIEALKLLPS